MGEQSALAVVQDVRGLAGALLYDCRPLILPVSIPLQNLRRSSVDRPTAPSSLAAAPVEVTPGFSGSVRERVATPGFVEMPSDERTRDRFGGRVGVRLPVTDDDFTASRLRHCDSDVSKPIFGTTTAGAGWLSYSTSGGERATDV